MTGEICVSDYSTYWWDGIQVVGDGEPSVCFTGDNVPVDFIA